MIPSTDQLALLAHIQSVNEKTLTWIAEAPDQRGAGIITEDLEYWAASKVFSLADFERYELLDLAFETYENHYGCKPNYAGLSVISNDELRTMISVLSNK